MASKHTTIDPVRGRCNHDTDDCDPSTDDREENGLSQGVFWLATIASEVRTVEVSRLAELETRAGVRVLHVDAYSAPRSSTAVQRPHDEPGLLRT